MRYIKRFAIVPTPSTGGAAGIPGLMAGAYDVTYGNVVSTFLAVQQGFNLKVVAPGTKILPDAPEGAGLVARKADAIKSGKDLEGKTVAVNTSNGVIWLYAYAWIKKTGGDPTKVTFKEVPFPQMVDAMRGKQIDAAFAVDPFFTNALADTATFDLVTRPYREVQPGLEVGQYVTTQEFFGKNQETVRKFYRALAKGVDWYNHNLTSADVNRIIAAFTRMKPEVVAQQKLGQLPVTMEVAQLAKTMQLMKESGLLKADIDLKTLVDPVIAK